MQSKLSSLKNFYLKKLKKSDIIYLLNKKKEFSLMKFDDFITEIQSDEFASEWEEFSTMLDEIMREHIEVTHVIADTVPNV